MRITAHATLNAPCAIKQHIRYAVYSTPRCIWHTVNAMKRKGFPSLQWSNNSYLSCLIFQQSLQLVSPHHTQLKNLPQSSLLTVTQSNNCTVHTVQIEKENRISLFVFAWKKMTKQKKLNRCLLYNLMSCSFYCILHSVKTKKASLSKKPGLPAGFFFCKSSCLAPFLWLRHRSTTVTLRYLTQSCNRTYKCHTWRCFENLEASVCTLFLSCDLLFIQIYVTLYRADTRHAL